MPMLNYTTKIDASKTAGEIMGILGKIGARNVSITYVEGVPDALDFIIPTAHGQEMRFRLPARVEGVYQALYKDWDAGRLSGSYATRPHATRVAWRVLKDWVEAQVAMIQSGMVKAEEVMLPYALTGSGVTFFEAFVEEQKALGPGRSS